MRSCSYETLRDLVRTAQLDDKNSELRELRTSWTEREKRYAWERTPTKPHRHAAPVIPLCICKERETMSYAGRLPRDV